MPTLCVRVDLRKEIAGKEWSENFGDATAMPTLPPNHGAIGAKLLSLEIFDRDMLSVRLRVDNSPIGRRAAIVRILGAHGPPSKAMQ
jgi:hypothetical protein